MNRKNEEKINCNTKNFYTIGNEDNLEKALEFVDLFYDNNLDKINFLKQYIKGYELSLKRKELVRTNKFWV